MIAALDRAASAFACVQNVKATAVIVFSVIQLAVAASLAVSYALHPATAFICAIRLTSTPAAYIFSRWTGML